MPRCQHQQKTILPIKQFIQYFFIIGENIFTHIVAGFESLNIKEDAWKTAVWTTDRAANMKATFSRHRRLDCVAHVINTCVKIHCRRGWHSTGSVKTDYTMQGSGGLHEEKVIH